MDEVQKWLKEYRTAKHLDQKIAAAENLAAYIEPKLHRYISSRCPRKAVDDVLQNTLIGIIRALPKFKGIGEFDHWCFRIARNKLADHLQTERRHKAESLHIEEIWKLIEASSETTPLTADDRDRLEEALAMVTQAKPPCLHYLMQRFFYGLDYKELGQSMGKTAAAARQQVARCIELAQELISKKGAAHV